MVDLAEPEGESSGEAVLPKVEVPKRSPAIPAVDAAKKVRRSSDRDRGPRAIADTLAKPPGRGQGQCGESGFPGGFESIVHPFTLQRLYVAIRPKDLNGHGLVMVAQPEVEGELVLIALPRPGFDLASQGASLR